MSQTAVIRPSISIASSSSAFESMSQTKTLAPLAANARAISRPMPEAPAVTNTRLVTSPRFAMLHYPRHYEARRALDAICHTTKHIP